MLKRSQRRIIIYVVDIIIVSFSLFLTLNLLDRESNNLFITGKFQYLILLNILISSIIYNFTGQYKGISK